MESKKDVTIGPLLDVMSAGEGCSGLGFKCGITEPSAVAPDAGINVSDLTAKTGFRFIF
jgi:hypothetical protein